MMNKQRTELNEKVLIAGLGATGMSCVRYFQKHEVDIEITDTREAPPYLGELRNNYPEAKWCREMNSIDWAGITQLVVSPGVPLSSPVVQRAVASGIEVVGDVELFARAVDAPVVAITGSNGKSTVTSMVGEIARAAGKRVEVGGNIGVPVLDLLDRASAELYVLELSSFQLETTASLRLLCAVILNLSPDHLDRYRDVEDYLEAKKRIFSNAQTVLINRDDSRIAALESTLRQDQKVVRFGLSEPSSQDDYGVASEGNSTWLCRGSQRILNVDGLRVYGRHNWGNALAALAMAGQLGISDEVAARALEIFPGLPHRTEWLVSHEGVSWYNDSKGTNVGATVSAIRGLPLATADNQIVLIAGGIAKEEDFSALRDAMIARVKLALLIGRDATKIDDQIRDVVPTQFVSTLEEAVIVAKNVAEPGDCVVLSPACASFDMFDNFEHRGNEFRRIVHRVVH